MTVLPRYPAPAKLNLFLHVVGQREDGFHLLQTLFRLINLSDTLGLEVRQDGRLVLHRPLPEVPEDKDLCWRAARLLQLHTGCRLGADIELIKRLPMGGGLGGGSSDAATVLLVLNRLWHLDLPRQALQALALQLGADVPVFVFGQSAFAEGVGEELTAWTLPPAWYVVLDPGVHVSTPAIFKHPALTRDTPSVKIAALSEGLRQGALRNDLEPVACSLAPEVGDALRGLAKFGVARMTGSGACVFAAYDVREQAEQVLAQCMADAPPGLKGFVAEGLDRHPLYDFAD